MGRFSHVLEGFKKPNHLVLYSQNGEENGPSQNSSVLQGKPEARGNTGAPAVVGLPSARPLSSVCVPAPDQPSAVRAVRTVPGRRRSEVRAAPSRRGKFRLRPSVLAGLRCCLTAGCLAGGRATAADQREALHLRCQRVWL